MTAFRDAALVPTESGSPAELAREKAVANANKLLDELMNDILLAVEKASNKGARRLRWVFEHKHDERWLQKQAVKELRRAGFKARRTLICWLAVETDNIGLKLRW